MKFTLTPEQFESLRASLAKSGVVLTGDSGSFDSHGFKGTFAYDGTTLDVQVTSEPLFFTASYFYSRLSEYVAGITG